MRALISVAPGPAEKLELGDLPLPLPKAGEVRIRVLACGLNYPDTLIINDRYQYQPTRPFAPGGEVSGYVHAVGSGVSHLRPGEPVLATALSGGLAEYLVAKACDTVAVPEESNPVEGAALLFTFGAALHALCDRGELTPGSRLLVLGAAGGLGLAAVQLAKLLGAFVVAAVSSAEKEQACWAAGADEVVVYERLRSTSASHQLARSFKDKLPSGAADVVLDPVGSSYSEAALRTVAKGGRYLVLGFTAGIPRLPLNLVLLKECDMRGVFYGSFAVDHPDLYRRERDEILAWWLEGRIRPAPQAIVPLDQARQALQRLAERDSVGRSVVTIQTVGSSFATSLSHEV
ncbi:NADPH:quinone oxidoreductase family protein [Sphingomonas sp. ID0503]|uniref:NADPH:quinone oxidoreductase family protein n=1 Tax=Sphingomonas sp. ID0503 TaxID=3399691 RepID=UPI003AFB04F8